jgi:hypothetical protein
MARGDEVDEAWVSKYEERLRMVDDIALDFESSSDGEIRTSGNVRFVRRNSNTGSITTHASMGLFGLVGVEMARRHLLAFK